MSVLAMVALIIGLIIYFTIGYLITKSLIKKEAVNNALDFWFFTILWLWIMIVMGLWKLTRFVLILPKRIAYRQIEKHS